MTAIDVLIVGSGPAGVSAAFPLVESGLSVVMLEAGESAPAAPESESYWRLRTEADDQWKILLGETFHALSVDGDVSPKFKVPGFAAMFARYRESSRFETDGGFELRGALARGGLSNAWGAGVAMFGDDELRTLTPVREALAASYRRVSNRIGVSGVTDDDLADFFGTTPALEPPAPLNPVAQCLLDRYSTASAQNKRISLQLGRARNAVLTKDRLHRKGCVRCGLCLWGCAAKSIYNSAFDLKALNNHRNFQMIDDAFVDSIQTPPTSCGVNVRYRKRNRSETITAPRVMLAAGAIGTARLVLDALGAYDVSARLLSNPVASFALLLPRLLGRATSREDFGLSQLSFVSNGVSDQGEYLFGNLFATTGLPLHEFVARAPLSQPASHAMLRLMAPAMLVGNCFFPGRLSDHSLTLQRGGALRITGGAKPELYQWVAHAKRTLARSFRRFGALMAPGGFAMAAPGADLHYAGATPMRADARAHETTFEGEVAGLPNVYVVDAAALPMLPAKPHTLTVMANADRIARGLAARMQEHAPSLSYVGR